MEILTASYIAKLCDGKLFGNDCEVKKIVRDNREICGGELFVAIRGENFDGHKFVSAAAEAGAAAVLVSEDDESIGICRIVVEDTVEALGKIAKGYLDDISPKKVCVTGSVGKTTTKEMCAAVLSAKYNTHKTQGNFNNNIGLPLTIFDLDKKHEAAVLEIGTNHFGEILPLAKIASPDVALITTIGESHLEAFGTKEGVLKEKTEIFKGLVDGGVAVLNGDDPLLWGIRNTIPYKTMWFGLSNPECDVYGEIAENGVYESLFRVRGSDVEFKLACGGEHNIRDALSAIAVGRVCGMDDEAIAKGLYSFKNTGMRQDIYEYNGITIIRDCYNANPDSMKAALSLLGNFKECQKRICALGDMRELGENAALLHREVGAVAASFADIILVTGDFAEDYRVGGGEKVLMFDDKKALSDALCEIAKQGDVLLVKGSYGTKMWQVLEYLQGEGECK